MRKSERFGTKHKKLCVKYIPKIRITVGKLENIRESLRRYMPLL